MDELTELLASWELSLRAERKSPQTVKSYGDGVRAYIRFCADQGRAVVIDRRQVREFIDTLLTNGTKPSTAVARQLAVRRFSAWLTEEGELETDPLLGMKPPKLDKPVTHPLSDDEIRTMLAACKGAGLRERRDEAILRLMFATGMRAGEVVSLKLADLRLRDNPSRVVVARGKGGKGRVVPIPPEVAAAIDRYMRVRRKHRLASSEDLWLGDRGKAFTYYALHKSLKDRALAAGIDRWHPHLARHTAAHRWLERGGSEGGLMAVAGWSTADMLQRYTRARAEDRAAAEAERLDLGAL
ncbi:tyrosine-type recombinase/integrase [Parenemella sanctibonifatiensis]|uniref:tyrosine-type recombinase/integrase n=1 Tax=Parenemella sanctibonifatiensis TaxID=2016505 RepID=UPI001E3F0061|nr:tyrosine-type recombinase/integrase [Parenemella sanctibonifatiensis]